MLRCRVDAEHLSTSVHYVAEPEFIAWRAEMEQRYGRLVSVDEASSWAAASSGLSRYADPATLWQVVRIHFKGCTSLGVPVSRFQFLASDSFQARAAQLAGLDVTPGHFLSSVPFTAPVVENVDERAAQEGELVAAIA